MISKKTIFHKISDALTKNVQKNIFYTGVLFYERKCSFENFLY